MKENVRHEVGCPGELVYTASDIHHRHAYIGSHPLFPRANGKLVLPREKLLTCTRCRDPLYLALYIPIGQCTFLYIFTCIKEGCCNEKQCWKALRYTVGPSEQQHLSTRSTDAAASSAREQQENLVVGDTWGISDVEIKNEDESFDFSDLMASLDATSHSKEVAMKDSARRPPLTAALVREEGFTPYIDPRRSSRCIAGFFVEFKNDDGKKGDGDVKPTRGEESRQSVEGEGEGEGWEGEGYEKDQVLVLEGRKGVSQAGWQFIKRVQNVPDQCVRRSLWAKDVDSAIKQNISDRPLWPHSDLPTPTSCPCCGSRRVFAVQLMAPMISAIAEAKEWLGEELGEGGETAGQLEVETLPLSAGWATVAVYMCEKLCISSKEGDYVEEEVAMGMED